jgi:parvulin-like peptidyl-prolyl isomerase
MPKRPANDPPPSRPAGPPPLRDDTRRPGAPKRRRRRPAREILRALRRRPTVATLREELGHVLVYGLWAFVIIFLIGGIQSFSAPREKSEQQEEQGQPVPVIASVDGEKLTAERWTNVMNDRQLNEPDYVGMKQQQMGNALDSWIREQVELQIAKKRHLRVSGADVDKDLNKKVEAALKQDRADLSERAYALKLQRDGSSLDAKRTEIRTKYESGRDDLRNQLLLDKVKKNIEDEVKISDDDLKDAYEEVSGRVILLRTGAMKPAPLGEGETATPEKEKQRAEGEEAWKKALDAKKADADKLLAEVKATPDKFADIAKAKSDDMSKNDGGEMKSFTRAAARFGDDFKKAVFALKPGDMTDLIAGDEGWVIFKCETRKTWPDDFQKADPRTFDEAMKLAQGVEAQLKAGADFAAIAKEKSEDPGSGKDGGELGLIGRGQMVKPFEKMAFALEKGAISEPFKSQFGVHILQVEDRELPKAGETVPPDDDPKPDPEDKKATEEAAELKALPLPATPAPPAMKVKVRHILFKAQDPEKQLADKRQQLEDRKKSEHYEKVVEDARKKGFADGEIKVYDPQMQAYLAEKEVGSKEAKEGAVLADLNRAGDEWPTTHPDLHLELAKQYERAQMMGAVGPDATKSQVAAVQALAKDPASVPGLVDALDSFLPDVRKAVMVALGDLKAQAAVDKLSDIVKNDPDPAIADTAKEALTKIGAPVPERTVKTPPAPSSALTPGKPAGANGAPARPKVQTEVKIGAPPP